MAACATCGKNMNFLNSGDGISCSACLQKEANKPSAAELEATRNFDERIAKILVTTEHTVDFAIKERIAVVTAECAYGLNIFKDVFASVRNLVGGRSKTLQDSMRNSRETVLYELKLEANRVGADAVIGVDLDYVQIGDNGWNMVLLVASGTAVRLDDAQN